MFNNIILTPLVFPYWHSRENLDKVWSMWNCCFWTSKQIKFRKYAVLPQLLYWFFFWKTEAYARNRTNLLGKLRQTSFHPSFCHLVLREREKKLKLFCCESWFHFNPELKSKSDIKACSYTLQEIFLMNFQVKNFHPLEDMEVLINIYVLFSGAVSLNNTFPLLLCSSAGMCFAWACIIVAFSLCYGKGLGMPWTLLLLLLFLVCTYMGTQTIE